MEIIIKQTGAEIAALACDAIEDLLRSKPQAVLGLATGSSPLAIYDELARRYREEGLSFAKASAFMLDEYVQIAADHPERYRNVIQRDIASRVDFAENAVHGPDGNADDLAAACADYEAAIAKSGGVDLQILGIGVDGHIAFNEPGSSLTSRTRVETLTPQTVADNARFFGSDQAKVPVHCLTQGLGTIMEARHLVLVATGYAKADAIAHLVEGSVSSMWPATIMQFHPHATVILDEAAASRLQHGDFYKHVYSHKPSWQHL